MRSGRLSADRDVMGISVRSSVSWVPSSSTLRQPGARLDARGTPASYADPKVQFEAHVLIPHLAPFHRGPACRSCDQRGKSPQIGYDSSPDLSCRCRMVSRFVAQCPESPKIVLAPTPRTPQTESHPYRGLKPCGVVVGQKFLSVEQAGQIVGVSGRTIRRWVASGRLTGYRVGPKLLRVSAAELDRLATPVV
ncbi:helix-turn-helix domain-containing protein [Gordonia amicalis]